MKQFNFLLVPAVLNKTSCSSSDLSLRKVRTVLVKCEHDERTTKKNRWCDQLDRPDLQHGGVARVSPRGQRLRGGVEMGRAFKLETNK